MKNEINFKSAQSIEEKYGTPLYLFKRSALRRQCEIINQVIQKQSNISAFYMMKANWHPEVVAEITNANIGVVVSSKYEMNIISNVPNVKVLAVGPAKNEAFLKQLVDANVELIIVENNYEAVFLNEYASMQNKIIRIGCRYDLKIKPHAHKVKKHTGEKFGWTKYQLIDTIEWFSTLENLRVCCISANIGSQICNEKLYIYALEQLIEISRTLKKKNIEIEYIDIGGGYPIPEIERKYSSTINVISKAIIKKSLFDEFEHYSKKMRIDLLLPILAEKCSEEGLSLIVEPGRWLVANSMQLLCKVVALKSKDKKEYIFVDAGIDILPDVGFGERRSFEAILKKPISNEAKHCIIAGPLCMKSDILSNDVFLDKSISVNDYILINSIGAYCLSRTSLFSGYIPSIIEIENEENVLFYREEMSIF